MNIVDLDKNIIREQLDFYSRGSAGCRFAQLVSGDSGLYKWKHSVVRDQGVLELDNLVDNAIIDSETNQLSFLFPKIRSQSELEKMLESLNSSEVFSFDPEVRCGRYRCVSLRAKILKDVSWVSGFAPLEFLPETRQAPYTELVFRVKSKQKYIKSVQPPTPDGELHVANLELPGVGRNEFTNLWSGSFAHTREILGHKPNLLSAAKTTFAIPL